MNENRILHTTEESGYVELVGNYLNSVLEELNSPSKSINISKMSMPI